MRTESHDPECSGRASPYLGQTTASSLAGTRGGGAGIGPPAWRVEQYKLQSQNSPLGPPALAKELNEDKKVRKGDSAY